MTYTLVLHDETGRVVSSRVFKELHFDGPTPTANSRFEEYAVAIKAREMYRDAAHAAGKFRPWLTKTEGDQRAE